MKNSLNLWLMLVVVVCGLSLWFGKDLIRPRAVPDDNTGHAGRGLESFDKPEALAEAVHLVVLNGTAEAGLAREFSLLLGQVGCVVERIGNAPHDHFRQTILVNRQLSPAGVRLLAAELGGLPVVSEFDQRAAADAVLVLGRDTDKLRTRLREWGTSEP